MRGADPGEQSMLLNAFDVDPGSAERTVELQAGELFALGLQADLLVVSAYAGNYEPVPGTLVARLHGACGIQLGKLPRALDLSASKVGAWVIPLLWNQFGNQPHGTWPRNHLSISMEWCARI
jgi:hypothetical protein